MLCHAMLRYATLRYATIFCTKPQYAFAQPTKSCWLLLLASLLHCHFRSGGNDPSSPCSLFVFMVVSCRIIAFLPYRRLRASQACLGGAYPRQPCCHLRFGSVVPLSPSSATLTDWFVLPHHLYSCNLISQAGGLCRLQHHCQFSNGFSLPLLLFSSPFLSMALAPSLLLPRQSRCGLQNRGQGVCSGNT